MVVAVFWRSGISIWTVWIQKERIGTDISRAGEAAFDRAEGDDRARHADEVSARVSPEDRVGDERHAAISAGDTAAVAHEGAVRNDGIGVVVAHRAALARSVADEDGAAHHRIAGGHGTADVVVHATAGAPGDVADEDTASHDRITVFPIIEPAAFLDCYIVAE